MKVIKKGFIYDIENFEDKTETQRIHFIDKQRSSDGSVSILKDGTTNEELVKVLIDRIYALDEKNPCVENLAAIQKLEEALFWMGKRYINKKIRLSTKQKQEID